MAADRKLVLALKQSPMVFRVLKANSSENTGQPLTHMRFRSEAACKKLEGSPSERIGMLGPDDKQAPEINAEQ